MLYKNPGARATSGASPPTEVEGFSLNWPVAALLNWRHAVLHWHAAIYNSEFMVLGRGVQYCTVPIPP